MTAKQGNYYLGLMCQGCDAHAEILGFLNNEEAQDYARYVLGWQIFEGDSALVFCPKCRINQPVVRVTTPEDRLYRRTMAALRHNQDVDCTADEWPEVRRIIEEYKRKAQAEKSYVTLIAVQTQEERLVEMYGE